MVAIRYRPELKEKGRWHKLAGRISYGDKKLAEKKLKEVVKRRRSAGIKVQKSRIVKYNAMR